MSLTRPGGNAIARPRTFLDLVIDSSISMQKIRTQTINAVNRFLDEQRRDRIDELFVTLTTFDTKATVHYRNVPIAEVPPVTERVYAPRGCTALYDGIAAALSDMAKAAGIGDRVLVTVATDGEENSSREVTSLEELLTIKRSYEARGNWTFVYLGGMSMGEALRQGREMGFRDGNISSYLNVEDGLAAVSSSVKSYRTSDDLKTDDFFTPKKRWQKPQWATESK